VFLPEEEKGTRERLEKDAYKKGKDLSSATYKTFTWEEGEGEVSQYEERDRGRPSAQ